MDDQATDPGGDDRAEAPVSAWLDELAESEGMTRAEALERLVSSYWRLEEISTLLAEGGEVDPAAEGAEAPGADVLDWPTDPQASRPPAGESADFDRLVALVAVLADRVQGLESTLTEEVDAPADHDADLAARVEALDEAIASVREDTVTEDELAAELEAIRESVADEREGREALRDLIRTEFQHIRTILEHLVESTGSTEGRTDWIAAELRDTVRPQVEDRERLAGLLQTAQEAGVRRADCGSCGASVDLTLLEAAACPGCGATLADLATTTAFLGRFKRGVLTTEDG